MALTVQASEAAIDRWVRVKCGQTTLHECPFDEVSVVEGAHRAPAGRVSLPPGSSTHPHDWWCFGRRTILTSSFLLCWVQAMHFEGK